ncbi:MAG: FAD-dependent oxidoreductase [Gammaproteobacteria bacterium]|nr:FAD-dependent oxidoreductase [Gammaproteobacteria bacterium]
MGRAVTLKQHVAIIGAGWAGLAAGVSLAQSGFRVTVLEAAPKIGGRARTLSLDGVELDNGQHLFIGAYRELLSLFNLLGVPEQDVFVRKPLHLRMLNREGHPVLDFKLLGAPSSFHRAMAILKNPSLSWQERFSLLSFFHRLKKNDLLLKRDLTGEAFLKQMAIPSRLSEVFFAPICQAALSTSIQMASAQVFIRVLTQTFGRDHDSDLLFPKKTLSACFPNPAARFIEKNGGRVLVRERVVGFHKNEQNFSIFTAGGVLKADGVILATHLKACLALIEQEARLTKTARLLKRLGYQPITTLYFQYPFLPPQTTHWEMIGLVGTTSQWLFNRSEFPQGTPGLVSVVISGEGPHMTWPKNVLLDRVEQELKSAFLHGNTKSLKRWMIREKEAALYASPDCAECQPKNSTSLPGLWLAGDYTVAGYPSTLESAIRSGVECADLVHGTFSG